ncbi:MAG: tRNA (N(6)-L-threonylcarbamoyladenosine(37)-C(2))-methylthiotransferase MtaB [Alphaproteobacteria bacterium]|nr:tRNA (N(6)-L-threonylcarbamoyladenosine(37)-C(2))-methylthiotransferase MtaB [Alphaproteobacteria bacterium]
MKIITFGCRMNTFESAVMARLGVDLSDNVILVNTCAVTHEAERQCRQTIRKLKRENPDSTLIVAGCAAQLNPEFYAQMPEVDRVLGNREKLNKELLCGKQKVCVGDMNTPFDLPIVSDFEGRTRAFLQIQQGCSHHCTFCIVRFARGKNQGLPPEQVIEQAKTFAQNGFCEIVLTGADVASYPDGLCALCTRLLNEVPQIKRLRFGSLDPAALDENFVKLVKKYPCIMPHFHLSIQSGDDTVLRLMARRHRRNDILNLVQNLRQVRPEVTFGADFITGFPQESDENFQNTLALVRQANITHLHVFPYSERPGTPAVKLKQVPVNIRKERAKILRDLGQSLYSELLKSMVGKKVSVLAESDKMGWTENYLHVILNEKVAPGQLVQVLIKGVQDNALVG